MAIKKVKDLAVKTGEYQSKDGKQKNRYINIGSVMKSDNGEFILLNRTFNPAGVPNESNRDTVLVSIFEASDREMGSVGANAGTSHANAGFDDMESDVPF
jgi:hypothetical protein